MDWILVLSVLWPSLSVTTSFLFMYIDTAGTVIKLACPLTCRSWLDLKDPIGAKPSLGNCFCWGAEWPLMTIFSDTEVWGSRKVLCEKYVIGKALWAENSQELGIPASHPLIPFLPVVLWDTPSQWVKLFIYQVRIEKTCNLLYYFRRLKLSFETSSC